MRSFKPSQESKEEIIQRLIRKYEQTLRENFTQGPQTLEQIEREVSKGVDFVYVISSRGLGSTCTLREGFT